MYLDAYTISALVDEMMDDIVGGRIQNSVAVDSTGIGLEIYANRRRRYLYMSADKQAPRVHVVDTKLRRGLPKPSQLALLVRRYVENGILMHVSQPPFERVLQFDISGPEGEVALIVEPMERRSNVILLRDGVILDAARRVGPEDNRYRLTLPNHDYVPPPPQTGRLDPTAIDADALVAVFEENDDPKRKAYSVLSSRLLGFSPLLAKEVVHRAGYDLKAKARDIDPATLYPALVEVIAPLKNREWQPGIVRTDGDTDAFSVYPLQHMAGWQPIDSVSDALTAFFGTPSGPDGYKVAKRPVREAIKEAQGKLGAKLRSLESALKDGDELEELRKSGELILAYQYGLTDDQTELKAQYDPDGPELVIKLQMDLTPVENAQRYFRKYEKSKRALDEVPQLAEQTRIEIDYLSQLATDLDLAGNWPEIDEIRQELREMGHWQGEAPRKIAGGGQSAPLRLVSKDGFVIWVGRNSRQNNIVTFGKGGGDDLWLHARDVPGAHVVIKFDGRTIPEDVIMQAASVAAYYSAKRTESAVIVDVTQCKHVRKIKGAAAGMVTYRNEETRTVQPLDETAFETP